MKELPPMILLPLLSTLFLSQGLHAQVQDGLDSEYEYGDQYGQRYEDVMTNISDANYGTFDAHYPDDPVKILNHVRRERFYLVLPRVMRDREIDMWIHIIRPWAWGGTDPLRYEFGTKSAVLVFTDRGGDQIEKVVFQGEVQDPGAYDIVGERYRYQSLQDYELMDYAEANQGALVESELALRFEGLGEFVSERDPRRIAVNYIDTLSVAEGSETFTMALGDGISYTDYVELTRALGEIYARRMISAENLILDYLSRRVAAEVVLNGARGYNKVEDGSERFEKISAGVTTLADIGGGPAIDKNGNQHRNPDYVIQRGDLIGDCSGFFWYCGYVLRKNETTLPDHIKEFWIQNRRVREILKKNVRLGMTGGEMLDLLAEKLEAAGFIYTDYQEYNKYVSDPDKMQVHIDMHAEGKGILAPRISPMGPRWHWDMDLQLFHMFAVEYMIYQRVEQWDRANNFTGRRLYAAFHDGGIITSRGMEIPYPDHSNKIQIIQ
tara:strand:- start:205 stop:1686 length:1482 start_codon:yes stop_codon:yes gene_type:complete